MIEDNLNKALNKTTDNDQENKNIDLKDYDIPKEILENQEKYLFQHYMVKWDYYDPTQPPSIYRENNTSKPFVNLQEAIVSYENDVNTGWRCNIADCVKMNELGKEDSEDFQRRGYGAYSVYLSRCRQDFEGYVIAINKDTAEEIKFEPLRVIARLKEVEEKCRIKAEEEKNMPDHNDSRDDR